MTSFKTEIEINEVKVINEGAYKLEDIYNAIDKLYFEYNLSRIESDDKTRVYVNNGNSDDFGNMIGINLTLAKCEWFNSYVSKWCWYLIEDTDNPDDVVVEDLMCYALNPTLAEPK